VAFVAVWLFVGVCVVVVVVFHLVLRSCGVIGLCGQNVREGKMHRVLFQLSLFVFLLYLRYPSVKRLEQFIGLVLSTLYQEDAN